MTQDEIIEMAVQAGANKMVSCLTAPNGPITAINFDLDNGSLEAFAKLVAAKEREACAKVCDRWPLSAENMMRMDSWKGNKNNAVAGSIYECASLIRARGEP